MRTALTVIALLSSASCLGPGAEAPSNAARGDGLGIGAACTQDAQCAAGLECEHGACAVDDDDRDGGEHRHGNRPADAGEDERHDHDGGDDDDRCDGGDDDHRGHGDGGDDDDDDDARCDAGSSSGHGGCH